MLGENTKKALVDFGADVVKFAKINIGDSNRKRKSKITGKIRRGKIDFSGKLRNSFESKVKLNKNSVEMQVTAEDYADDVNSGERRKANFPDILNWVKKKPARLRDANGKFIKMTDKKQRSFANFIKWKVENIGSDKTNYLNDAIEFATKKHEADLVDNIFLDTEDAITFILNNLNNGTNSR